MRSASRAEGPANLTAQQPETAILSLDYLYFTKGLTGLEVVERDDVSNEDEAGACVKVLVAKDLKSGSVFARVVLQKVMGADGYAVARLVEDIKWLGYAKLLVKSDNEPAIVALCDEALRRLRVEGVVQVSREGPSAYDSSSNGALEGRAGHAPDRQVGLRAEDQLHGARGASHPGLDG